MALTVERLTHHGLEGAGGLLPLALILLLALTLVGVARELGTGDYVAQPASGRLPPVVLLPLIFVAASLAGAVFGDHASPISDTTVVASMAAATDRIAHVCTQLSYALLAAGIAVVAFAVLGLFILGGKDRSGRRALNPAERRHRPTARRICPSRSTAARRCSWNRSSVRVFSWEPRSSSLTRSSRADPVSDTGLRKTRGAVGVLPLTSVPLRADRRALERRTERDDFVTIASREVRGEDALRVVSRTV